MTMLMSPESPVNEIIVLADHLRAALSTGHCAALDVLDEAPASRPRSISHPASDLRAAQRAGCASRQRG